MNLIEHRLFSCDQAYNISAQALQKMIFRVILILFVAMTIDVGYVRTSEIHNIIAFHFLKLYCVKLYAQSLQSHHKSFANTLRHCKTSHGV